VAAVANVLIYATASISDVKVMRARDLIARAMRAASSVLLLQTLAEFSNVAIRKARIPNKDIRRTIDAWCAVLRVQAADDSDLLAALEAVRAHRLAFWDAMLWASARRAGVRHLHTEGLPDGFALQGVTFINPFNRENDQLIEDVLSVCEVTANSPLKRSA
jgi:predicted nucleic acid-binding protein